MEGGGREEERDREREGGRDNYRWRGERGKNIYCTICIDFSVDDDFYSYLIAYTICIDFSVDVYF